MTLLVTSVGGPLARHTRTAECSTTRCGERQRPSFWEEQVDPNAVKRRLVDRAKGRHAKQWEPPAEGQAAESAEYRMTFGKCSAGKGKTVAEVLAVDSNDSEHLTSWKNNVLEPPDLRDALDKAGLLSGMSERRPSMQRARAEKIFAQASDTLASWGPHEDDALAVVASEGSAKRKRGSALLCPGPSSSAKNRASFSSARIAKRRLLGQHVGSRRQQCVHDAFIQLLDRLNGVDLAHFRSVI